MSSLWSHLEKKAVNLAAAFLLLYVTMGCDALSLPPFTYETNRTYIGTSFEQPVCQGDLAWLDHHIDEVETLLGVPRRHEKYEIYLFDEIGTLPCKYSPVGCFLHVECDGDDCGRGREFVAAVWDVVDHELIHSITRDIQFPSAFWDEGTASLVTQRGTQRGIEPLSVAALSSKNGRKGTANMWHFVRFFTEQYGIDATRRVIRRGPIEDVVGVPISAIVDKYNNEAPWAYPPWHPCPHPDIPEQTPGIWGETLTFSCDSPEASQFEWEGASVVRRVKLKAGTYSVEVEGGLGVRMVGCHTEILAEQPPFFSNMDLLNQADTNNAFFGTFFPSGQVHVLALTDGYYRLALSAGRNTRTTLRVEIRRLDQ